MNKPALTLVAAALATLAYLPGASAENPRDYLFGGSIGRGSMSLSCPGCGDLAPLSEALSVNVYAGKMVNERLAFTADYWQVRYQGRDNRWFGDSADHQVNQTMMTVGAKLWLTGRLWFSGGIGLAHHDTDGVYEQARTGIVRRSLGGGDGAMPEDPGSTSPAMVSAIGFEVARNSRFALDIQLRAGAARDETGLSVTNSAITFGLNWF